MKEQNLHQVLTDLAEDLVPAETINLWPAIKKQLSSPTRLARHTFQKRWAWIALPIILIGLFFTIIPQGQVLAQEILHFFVRKESDILPLQAWQLTPPPTPALNTTTTSDPSNILEAKFTVAQIEEQSGFDLREPTWLPENMLFVGATFDSTNSVARFFYQQFDSNDSNGLVLKEEIYTDPDSCVLCNAVGESARVETVQIGNVYGEYVQGVWHLTDNGPIWENDPFLQNLRWQIDGIAYDLLFMGQPDFLTKEDLVKIANSLK
ncbi:MAG: hypothetical protein CVU41_11830 [Chloroflexi bacterium HGW-Chloroflexi-3]|nr:MAG: hypothetical protein CVU41_11830 [Chloroflexi bacterium HGW-Chloroflexi-3]